MKKFLWPAVEKLLRVERKKRGFRVEAAGKAADRYAFVGVRGCDVSALEVLDRVFMSDKLFVESYVKMRKSCFILAVNCTNPSSTCFCDSMGNGPEVVSGYDLLLTELGDAVLIEVGSEKGAKMVRLLGLKQAKDDMFEEKAALIERAKKGMKRHLDKEGVRRALQDSYESPVWRDVAGRCLACGNCTSVCPTCFCSDVIDRIELLDDSVERIRVWDSCFNLEFSYTAGFPIRGSITSRYRQWFSHKFGYWREQFGPFGCVGCGRCITWCPVGIDVTEVARLLPSRTPAIRR
jgi:ferredoxin